MNPALARLLGYDSPEQLLRELARDAASLYVDAEHAQRVAALLRSGGRLERQRARVRRRDGSVIWISENARAIRDGIALLEELGALDPDLPDGARGRLTRTGRHLVRLPIDPRLGRMVLEAERQGCVREVLLIASALSIQDVRERPLDQQQWSRP